MARDILRLMGLRAFLKDHKGSHDQKSWGQVAVPGLEPNNFPTTPIDVVECGGTACAAGWTCILNGYKPHEPSLLFNKENSDGTTSWLMTKVTDNHGLVYGVADTARDLLGLPYAVTSGLFSSDLTPKQVRKALTMLINGKSDDDVVAYMDDCIEENRDEE